MQFLHTVHCVILNNLYNKHWNWYLFWLLHIHKSPKKTFNNKNGSSIQTLIY